ncbi:MAG: acyl-CoA/acyl-ACP dehydrogenase [Desulfobacteraceae bacterium]|nr:acyl-CoA/acyl-ACP dehydrogenase [Desulfobacteraceae bacterium]
MDNLVSVLDSFHNGWGKKAYVKDLITILREQVIPTYPSMRVKIQDNKASFPDEWDQILSALKEARIFDLFVPSEYGGKKASEHDIYLMMELFGYASPGLGVIFVSHGRAVDIILRGNEEQKGEYLPRMVKGHLGAIAMTEEKAGSDPSAIGLIARKADGRFLFTGEKIFISNSGLADIYTILVRTKEEKGPRSLSVFVVEDGTDGFSIKDLPEKGGLKILPTGRLIFRDSPVPSKNLIGEEGRGLLLTLDAIDRGRIDIAGICCGLAYRIFREIYHYAHRRRQFDHPLTSSQDISFQISEMFTQVNAARGLCFHALKQIGTPYYRISSSQAKLFAAKMVMNVAARAQILMGARGYLRNALINQLNADARGMEYLEGTSNVQKMIIGRELFRIYRKEKDNLSNDEC